jgi:PiT family inorganic phosphate transporter
LLAAVLNFLGAFTGVGVAKTIGEGIARPADITQTVVCATLIGAITWNLFTWYYGIPSSSSHALIGGIVGAAWAHAVLDGIDAWDAIAGLATSSGVRLAVKALFLSPVFGMLGGFLFMIFLLWIVRKRKPESVNRAFRSLQLVSASFMAFAHGSNDAQKSMGVIAMALATYATGREIIDPDAQLHIPNWVIVSCALAMALGTASGGWRIMKTMGHKIIRLRPIHGFAAETAAATVILTASALKAPVSTTHVIAASIMGVGASRRVSAVRWGVARSILTAWVLTIPISALIAAGVYWFLHVVVRLDALTR